MYWRGEDRLEPPDAPPLTRLVEGWVPLALDAPLQQDTEQWRKGEQWAVGTQMLDAMGPEGARRLTFLSRLPMLVFPLLLLGVAWAWVRELLGPTAALAATAMLALEPNLLGHGADQVRRAGRDRPSRPRLLHVALLATPQPRPLLGVGDRGGAGHPDRSPCKRFLGPVRPVSSTRATRRLFRTTSLRCLRLVAPLAATAYLFAAVLHQLT
ncbi:MAG: hypothetical protein R2748_15015 [Bryobacterales bacterium]